MKQIKNIKDIKGIQENLKASMGRDRKVVPSAKTLTGYTGKMAHKRQRSNIHMSSLSWP